MPDSNASLGHEEYRALRATIRERGTARVAIAAFTFVAWATLSIVVQATLVTPAAVFIPLVVLAAGFEIVFSLHVGVERIGRYLQVHFEGAAATPPAWETAVMRIGPPAGAPASSLDPLFTGLFGIAAVLNAIPAALQGLDMGASLLGLPVEPVIAGLLHLVFIARLVQARRFSGRQRQRDLDLFRQSNSARL